ncbi:unnamed protein product [Gongylonema pulchrum]|uniref:DRBM domain-containing protein n=1 Tax=Gongylonema pulchrum TaxID=637853 RepID=A0A3P7PXU8_9BILA|nr:unnamed protein product [Gongylonema pulchrum]
MIQELGLVMPYEDDSMKRAAAVLSPPYALHQLMVKQNRKKLPDIVYDEPEDISEAPNKPPMFKCTLTVNGTERFEGTGQSKKAAKSAAAEQALTKLFKVHISSEECEPNSNLFDFESETESSLFGKFMYLSYKSLCKAKRAKFTKKVRNVAYFFYMVYFSIVLIAPDGEKKMVALGAGRHAVIDGQILSNAHGNVLVHMQGAVLARRAFLLYLHNQIRNLGDENSVIERCPTSNKYRIKVCFFAAACCNGGSTLELTPDVVQTFDEMAETGRVNVMSLADKMLKWNNLGLQGALLSYIFEPIYMTHLCVGTPTIDKAIAHAVLLRFGDARKGELVIKSSQTGVVPHGEMYHNWVAGIGTIERLDPFTGRTVSGSPSRLCKFELYESWARAIGTVDFCEIKPIWSCAEAKRNDQAYQQTLEDFHTQLQQNGLGTWQRKDTRIDSFQLASFDE